MDAQSRENSLMDLPAASSRQLDHSDSGEAVAEDNRVPSRADTPERLMWGIGPEPASWEPADLAKHDPRERGILVSLYDTILENFPVLLRRLATGARAPATQAEAEDGSTDVCTEPTRLTISDPTTASQYASLQRAFIRFDIWGRDFDVASGALDKKLENSEDLKEDIILVLLQLCDAVYQGLPLLTKNGFVPELEEQPSTVRILEIAKFYVGEFDYLGVDDRSFATIVDEILTAAAGLGDLSFCLEAPVEVTAVRETSRPPHEVRTAQSHRVYEEMMHHRFPKADPKAIAQHAAANYYRLITLQEIRNQVDNLDGDEEPVVPCPNHHVDPETQTLRRTLFHDSGIGTTHRHESSYAQSLMSFTRQGNEQYAKLLPKLPEAGALGRQFDCVICLRKVQFENEGLWNAHVLDDLLPYVCIVQDCERSTLPFDTRYLWLNHLKIKHESSLSRPDLTCNLCAEVVTGDHKSRVAHAENHLVEIALSVLPAGEDDGPEEESKVGLKTRSQASGIASMTRSQVTRVASMSPRNVTPPELNETTASQLELGGPPPIDYYNPPSSPDARDLWETSRSPAGLFASMDPTAPMPPAFLTRLNTSFPRFPCLLKCYGCNASCSSIAEWKSHHATEHFKFVFWRCYLCAERFGSHVPSSDVHNDFNQKDLFTQHLRRMHATPRYASRASKEHPVNEDNLSTHQDRCMVSLRRPPEESSCMMCPKKFSGPNSWEEHMEHVAQHLEHSEHNGLTEAMGAWQRCDLELEAYMLREGLVIQIADGTWAIGDGIPLRDLNLTTRNT